MARAKPKQDGWPFDGGKRTALPKLPFSMGNRGDFIKKAFVAVQIVPVPMVECLVYSIAYSRVETTRMAADEIDLDHQGRKQYYVDGDHAMGGPEDMGKNHLRWLRDSALRNNGATPDAIRLMKMVMKITKAEEADMAAKDKLAKKTTAKKNTTADAGGEPVGGGGKVATKSKGNPEALKKAREAKAAAGPDNRKIKIVNKENPYRAESNRASSFDALKGAKTVEDYVAAGGKTKYLSRWESEGRITLG